jgi:large repetitive protein
LSGSIEKINCNSERQAALLSEVIKMIRRFFATWALPVSAGLAAFTGCGQNNVDTFGGIVDASVFDEKHTPNTDVDGDGIIESLFPQQGYINGKVVQFFDFGPVPALFNVNIDKFVTTPNFLFRLTGNCKAPEGKVPFTGVEGIDFDPRFDTFSPFGHHDIVEFLPDGADADGDENIDYNPILQVVTVAVPNGTDCNSILSGTTLRKRLASEDVNGNGILDRGEDTDNDNLLDDDLNGDLVATVTNEFVLLETFEAFTRLPDLVFSSVADPSNKNGRNLGFLLFDPDGFSEDLDIDQRFEIEPELDVNANDELEDEDIDQDGVLDIDEDINGDGQLQAAEDVDGDNRLDIKEDDNNNGVLDVEDKDHDNRRDCGEVTATLCIAAEFDRLPITEDLNGNDLLDAGEDGSTVAFGEPNGILDTEDLNGDDLLSNTEDLNGDGAISGIQGAIPAYQDEFITFFNTFLLHVVEFRTPTLETEVLATEDLNGNGVLDAGEDGNANGVIDELTAFSAASMKMFVDAQELDSRPIFEFAPGEVGFQSLAEIVFYERLDPNLLAGEIASLNDLLAASIANRVEIDLEPSNLLLHVGFARSGAALDDSNVLGNSVFFQDTDEDGIPNFIEELLLGSDANDTDSDNDGLLDSEEDRNRDGDIGDFESSPLLADGDADGISDADEFDNGTNPSSDDTDEDGLKDKQEDIDADGIVDAGETDPSDADSDNDTLLDGDEIADGTNPNDSNTDNDCFTDDTEVNELNSDPANINSPVTFVVGSCVVP